MPKLLGEVSGFGLSLDEFSDLIFIVKDYLLEFYNWPVPEPTEKF